MTLHIPDDFFDQPGELPDGHVANPALVAVLDWLVSHIAEKDWAQRRMAALKHYMATSLGEPGGSDDGGRFYEERDLAAWYLLLLTTHLQHPLFYDYTAGCRVIPLFYSLGRDIELLKEVGGVSERVIRMLGAERAQVDAGIYELLVALAYKRAGSDVSFRPERPGNAKTHDMDVSLRGVQWAVECKRLNTSEYIDAERTVVRGLWQAASFKLRQLRLDARCHCRFIKKVETVPSTYLMGHLARWFNDGALLRHTWSDEFGMGSFERHDLRQAQAHFEQFDVNRNSAAFLELLTGRYYRGMNFLASFAAKPADNLLFIDSLDAAIVLEWESLSDEAINSKARDVMKRLSSAMPQLPDDVPGVVHIGLEAIEGDAVEARRIEKIRSSLARFDPRGKPLEHVYVNWFAPDCPPNELFDFQETASVKGIRPKHPAPLTDGALVVPMGEEGRPGAFWE